MEFCLELAIASDLAEEIRQSLALTPPQPLHLTLLIFECDDPHDVVLSLETKRGTIPRLAVSHTGVFCGPPPIVFLAPFVTQALLVYHEKMFSAIGRFVKSTDYLTRPNLWVPHVTLPCTTEQTSLDKALGLAAKLSHEDLTISGLFLRESISGKVIRSWMVSS